MTPGAGGPIMTMCDAVLSYRPPGYEHLCLSDAPVSTRPCGQPATVVVRYPRVRWTLSVCAEHIALHTDHGAQVLRREPQP